MSTHSLIQDGARPHHISPQKETVRIVQAVKNFCNVPGVCHIGLSTTANSTVKVLRRAGYFAEAWSTNTTQELDDKLKASEAHSVRTGQIPVSHVIVSAPSWVQPAEFKRLTRDYPNVEFVMLNHSGCAYLSIDKYGIRNNRELIELQMNAHNFRVAANNTRVVKAISRMFTAPILYLPNMYDTESFVNPYPTHKDIGSTLRIGSFGASRPWKNQLVAAEAGVALAKQLGVELEFYVNSKRPDGGERMIESRAEIFKGLRGCKLVDVPWEAWPVFRDTVGFMHLLFSPSFDESFLVVAADGIAVGTPSVLTSAVEWTPERWWSHPEDPADLVKVALYLLNDKYAIEEAREKLKKYVRDGLVEWGNYLVPR